MKRHYASMVDIPEQFDDEQYVNLETFRKNGNGVKTPVWFVTDGAIYVITRSKTGKVKRLRNNSEVKICPCSFNGEPKGEWISGNAELVKGQEAEKAIKLRKKKYGFKARLAGFMTKTKGDLVVYKVNCHST